MSDYPPGSVKHRSEMLRSAVGNACISYANEIRRGTVSAEDYSYDFVHEAFMVHMYLAEKGYVLSHHTDSGRDSHPLPGVGPALGDDAPGGARAEEQSAPAPEPHLAGPTLPQVTWEWGVQIPSGLVAPWPNEQEARRHCTLVGIPQDRVVRRYVMHEVGDWLSEDTLERIHD